MANSAPHGNPFASNFPGVKTMGVVQPPAAPAKAAPKPKSVVVKTAASHGNPFAPSFPGVAETKYVPPAKPQIPYTGNPQTDAILHGQKIQPPPVQQPLSLRAVAGALDQLGYLAAGQPFSKTPLGLVVSGKESPRQFVTKGFRQKYPGGEAGPPIAGIGPLPFRMGAVGKSAEALAAREAAKAAPHEALLTAAAKARAEGFGPEAKVPTLKPGEVTKETGGQLGAQVRGAVTGRTAREAVAGMSKQEKAAALEQNPLLGKTAAEVRNQQEAGYSVERAKRITAAKQAFENAGGGAAGHQAALSKLGGELPKLDWQGFKQFDQQALDALINHVHSLPNMQEFEKTATAETIMDAVHGKVPTQSGEALLERAFGREVTDQILAGVPFWKAARHLGLEVMNIPRAIMSSADLSAPLRQGLVAMVTHPVLGLKAFPQMFKSFGSERVFQGGMEALRNDPVYPLARKSGLPLTDIGESAKVGAKLSGREEVIQSNLAERIPVIGHMIRASDRAYVMFLNKVRIDVFRQLALQGIRDGRPTEGPAGEKFFRDLARFVGSATGRGPLGPFAKHAVSINAMFFSPRLLASRLDILLSPATYLTADPFVRKQALQATFNLVATMSLVLELAKLGGAKVGLDPTNADFAKIRIGNTRIDLAGGFQQPLRLAFELYEGKVTSSTTGKAEKLSGGVGKTSQGDVALRFIFSKFGPVPGFAVQASGVSQASFGPKQSLQSMALQRLIPLLAQDANDLRTQQGAFGGSPSIEKAIGGYGLGLFGVGMQTYGPQPPKSRSTPGHGNPFAGAGGGSTSNPFGAGAPSPASNPFG